MKRLLVLAFVAFLASTALAQNSYDPNAYDPVAAEVLNKMQAVVHTCPTDDIGNMSGLMCATYDLGTDLERSMVDLTILGHSDEITQEWPWEATDSGGYTKGFFMRGILYVVNLGDGMVLVGWGRP